ncbi:WD40 repeat-like protein [Pseudovirgaria hyperparasitica]|uniref:WD40 repeat-like protein n=1 Tax=Pseudovirgaria hyperparasitica TaxID=470096 RepID=A0A6A6VVZ0_9PEZI|nr:WD40 repeat-like protein [Pseudovirgaria hyperparasitica]KAF2754403.1 WD40 repeat-like protein [Pseudovirgaria hyperparasitica]
MSSRLKPASLRAPVTALATSWNLVLAGEGPYLRVWKYEHHTSPLLVHPIFEAQAIHGIATRTINVTDAVLVVWGGREIRVLHLKHEVNATAPDELSISIVASATAPDWILDLTLACGKEHSEGTTQVVLLTAHNALLTLDVNFNPASQHQVTPLRQITTGSRCILYAAHILRTGDDCFLVASGTAFGEIIVWSVESISSEDVTVRLCHVFTGHEGSIFGVQISHELSLNPKISPQRLLASCSDDRTIRIWNLSGIGDKAISNDPSRTLDALRDRETGFGANIEDINAVPDDRNRCIATAFGHLSRIWLVRFLDHRSSNSQSRIRLISAGEDASCQLWQLEAKSIEGKYAAVLEHLSTSRLHSGKNIWSISVLETKMISGSRDSNNVIVISGGADAAVVSRSFQATESLSEVEEVLTESVKPSAILDEEWTVPQALIAANSCSESRQRSPEQHNPASFFRAYSFISENEVLATTSKGHILKASIEPGKSLRWSLLQQLHDLEKFALCTSSITAQMAFIASGSGQIYCFQNQTALLTPLVRVDGKVAAIFARDNAFDVETAPREISLLITTVGTTFARRLVVDVPSTNASPVVTKADRITLEQGFTVTAYVHESPEDSNDGRFILGSREGAISLWDLNLESSHATLTMRHVHRNESVTALEWASESEGNLLFSVGRDGTCCVHRIDFFRRTFVTVHRSNLPFGPNIEGLSLDKTTGDVIAYGFHGKKFTAQSLNDEQELITIECGGAHRLWAYNSPRNIDTSNSGGTLIWTKASKLRICAKPRASYKELQHGGHGREIKACDVFSHGSSKLIATGAEDTDIKLFIPTQGGEAKHLVGFKCIRTVRKHVTGIQNLKWSKDGSFLFSSGGCEEFFVWRFHNVDVLRIGVVCEAVCPTISDVSDLRITDFDILEGHSDEDAESYKFTIAMTFSDSTIRIYDYTSTTASKKFALQSTGTYTTACLTKIAFLSPTTFVTASTNGHIAYWTLCNTVPSDAPPALVYSTHHRIHQSTIKSLAHIALTDGTSLIVTTGDDNALGLTLCSWSATTEIPSFSTLLIPRAHAAAINDCALLDSQSGVFAVTVSNDQRLKMWSIKVDLDKKGTDRLDACLVEDVPSAVADASSLCVYPDSGELQQEGVLLRVLVCGVGMEEWKFNTV